MCVENGTMAGRNAPGHGSIFNAQGKHESSRIFKDEVANRPPSEIGLRKENHLSYHKEGVDMSTQYVIVAEKEQVPPYEPAAMAEAAGKAVRAVSGAAGAPVGPGDG